MNSLLFGQFLGRENEIRDHVPIFVCDIVDAADVFSRHNQNMGRRLRSDVIESNDSLPSVDEIGILFSANDPAK